MVYRMLWIENIIGELHRHHRHRHVFKLSSWLKSITQEVGVLNFLIYSCLCSWINENQPSVKFSNTNNSMNCNLCKIFENVSIFTSTSTSSSSSSSLLYAITVDFMIYDENFQIYFLFHFSIYKLFVKDEIYNQKKINRIIIIMWRYKCIWKN